MSALDHTMADVNLDQTSISSEKSECAEYLLPDFRPYEGDIPEEWTNHAYQILQDRIGEQRMAELLEQQFQDAKADSGVLTDIGDMLKRTKLDLFNSSTLPMSTASSSPPVPVGGSGYLKIVSNPRFPEHEFFSKSRLMRVRIRHNNLSFEDDASVDGRVTSIKFSDDEQGGPLDLILHTGRVPQYYNAQSFSDFAAAFNNGGESLRKWCLSKPINYYSRIENLRKNPDSFYSLRYYSHVTYNYQTAEGVTWFARFRLLPADGSTETGLLNPEEQNNIWETEREREEEDGKPNSYLRDEYTDRLAACPLQYRLQIQLIQPNEDSESSQDSTTTTPDSIERNLINPCIPWDTSLAPWLDLAIITVSTMLAPEVLSKTKFNTTNHLAACAPVEMNSARDFSSLAVATREFHGIGGNNVNNIEPSLHLTVYKILVVTGKLLNAGTDGDVIMTITGTRGRTPPMSLDQKLHDDFEAGQTDAFTEQGPEVGDLLVIEMTLSSGRIRSRRWFLEEVTILDEAGSLPTRFPCYQWLSTQQPSVVIPRNQAVPPHMELLPLPYLQRKYELACRRSQYQWLRVENLPGRIHVKRYEDLPREAQFQTERRLDEFDKYARTLANISTGTVSTLLNLWDIIEDNPKLLTKFLKGKSMVRHVVKSWDSDVEFGRQILNGPHPTRLERVTVLPSCLEPGRADIENLLDRGTTLDQSVLEGNMYMLTYPELASLERSKDYKGKYKRYLTCPTCLLYVNKDDHLVPIAISLEEESPVWTPRDSAADWTFAKMWVREADAQIHLVVSRHLCTQLVMEAVTIATLRNLPSSHPVYKLLLPHLKYTLAVNVLGRQLHYPADEGLFQRYLAVGGQHDELIKEAYRNFHINQLHVPTSFTVRGVEDPESLPGYHYRDDALQLWHILEKFIRTVLYLHYRDDSNIPADEEIQMWIEDLGRNGFPQWDCPESEDPDNHGVPSMLCTLEELIHYVTMFVFTASAQHGALTKGLMDYYCYVPNAPTVIVSPPPSEKGKVNMDYVKKALPSKGKTAEIIAACYVLSHPGKHETYLTDFLENYFNDEATMEATDAFRTELERFQANIEQRNQTLDIPYTYLLPRTLPKSVSL